MKFLRLLFIGFVFGLVLTKSEAVSWYRIYEMFQFDSFHMYGIIITAVLVGIIGIYLIKKYNLKSIDGEPIIVQDKDPGSARYWIGGIIFGLGWGLVGSCPGPIFILLGAGFKSILIVFAGAMMGTFIYGLLRNKLPH